MVGAKVLGLIPSVVEVNFFKSYLFSKIIFHVLYHVSLVFTQSCYISQTKGKSKSPVICLICQLWEIPNITDQSSINLLCFNNNIHILRYSNWQCYFLLRAYRITISATTLLLVQIWERSFWIFRWILYIYVRFILFKMHCVFDIQFVNIWQYYMGM